jgi:trk system potassium uptake protein TrkH
MAFSAQTTTGFSTVPPGEPDAGSKLVLIAAMFIGGDAGSTAGGIKIIRFLIVLRLIQLCVLRPPLPAHAVAEPRIGERRLEDGEVQVAMAIVSLYIALIVASWLAFLAFGHDPLNALFEVVSAAGTVGLSTSISGPELHPLLKGVLCVAMLFGRLEVVAFLVLLDPRNWFGRRDTA